jgi:hypothetical protein
MTPRFLFRPAAVEGLREARDWYDAQRAGLGEELGEIVAHTLDVIARQPEAFPEVIPGVAPCRHLALSVRHLRSTHFPTHSKYSPSFIIAATRPPPINPRADATRPRRCRLGWMAFRPRCCGQVVAAIASA